MTNYHSQFLLDKEKDKSDARLRYRIKWDKNIVAFNLGFRVEIEKWSADSQRCKANTTHSKKKVPASVINKKIQVFEQAFNNSVAYFEVHKKTPTKQEFQDYFNLEIGRKKKTKLSKNLFECFDLFIIQSSKFNNWGSSTTYAFNSLKNNLYKYNKNISFEDLTEEELNNFVYYLSSQSKIKNSSIDRYIKMLKNFLKWAIKNKYTDNKENLGYKPKLKLIDKKIIFLTPTEFKLFQEYTPPKNDFLKEFGKDFFLFQCFTGMRYSDVINLKKTDIKDNCTYIEINVVKTNSNLKIELNNFSKSILQKYLSKNSTNNNIFPFIDAKKLNKTLKEISKEIGINEDIRTVYYIGNKKIDVITPKYNLITSHAGRRTFICNGLSLGIPPQIIMKWTGHSNYASMKPYIDIADEIKAEAMSKFNLL